MIVSASKIWNDYNRKNCIFFKQTTVLTSLFLAMINQIDKIMKLITFNAET